MENKRCQLNLRNSSPPREAVNRGGRLVDEGPRTAPVALAPQQSQVRVVVRTSSGLRGRFAGGGLSWGRQSPTDRELWVPHQKYRQVFT
uniref:Uncharacterized protein n=1 Tax=Mycena chlorophos TaxID=658473 RepID=A0ABQ0LG32_MYCCL|nr:predicted protein [Mycena chlorophos]